MEVDEEELRKRAARRLRFANTGGGGAAKPKIPQKTFAWKGGKISHNKEEATAKFLKRLESQGKELSPSQLKVLAFIRNSEEKSDSGALREEKKRVDEDEEDWGSEEDEEDWGVICSEVKKQKAAKLSPVSATKTNTNKKKEKKLSVATNSGIVSAATHTRKGNDNVRLPKKVDETIDTICNEGFCKREELDDRVIRVMARSPQKISCEALEKLRETERGEIRNLSAYLSGLIHRIRRRVKASKSRTEVHSDRVKSPPPRADREEKKKKSPRSKKKNNPSAVERREGVDRDGRRIVVTTPPSSNRGRQRGRRRRHGNRRKKNSPKKKSDGSIGKA